MIQVTQMKSRNTGRIALLGGLLLLLSVACAGGSSQLAETPAGSGATASSTPTASPATDPIKEREMRGDMNATATQTVVGDPPAVADLIYQLRQRGVSMTVIDVDTSGVRDERWCLNAPRRSYELVDGVGGGRLDVFLYTDVRAVRVAAKQFGPDGDCQRLHRAVDVIVPCGEMILFLTRSGGGLSWLQEDVCAPPEIYRIIEKY